MPACLLLIVVVTAVYYEDLLVVLWWERDELTEVKQRAIMQLQYLERRPLLEIVKSCHRLHFVLCVLSFRWRWLEKAKVHSFLWKLLRAGKLRRVKSLNPIRCCLHQNLVFPVNLYLVATCQLFRPPASEHVKPLPDYAGACMISSLVESALDKWPLIVIDAITLHCLLASDELREEFRVQVPSASYDVYLLIFFDRVGKIGSFKDHAGSTPEFFLFELVLPYLARVCASHKESSESALSHDCSIASFSHHRRGNFDLHEWPRITLLWALEVVKKPYACI